MVKVTVSIEFDHAVYATLLEAANEVGLGVSEFANGVIENYLGENYGSV